MKNLLQIPSNPPILFNILFNILIYPISLLIYPISLLKLDAKSKQLECVSYPNG